MTRFRMPPSWADHMKDPDRDMTQRPPIRPWLRPDRSMLGQPASVKRSYEYWGQIHLATPPWMTAEMWAEMRQLYESANPAHQQLDHLVPLKHRLVCGLNVPWNMAVATIRDNQLKSNHYWPDCPDHLCPIKNLPVDMFGFNDKPYQLGLAI